MTRRLPALAGFCLALAALNPAHASSAGPPAGMTGVPAGGVFHAEQTCQSCHAGQLNPDAEGRITLTGVPPAYAPGKTYKLVLQSSHPSAARWGFSLTAVAKGSFKGAGVFAPVDKSTQVKDGEFADRTYIEHGLGGRLATGIGSRGSYAWTFNWTAPAKAVGDIQFYAAAVMANADNNNTGDKVYTRSPAPLAVSRGK